MAKPRDGGKHRTADSPVAGVAGDDAKPAAGAVARVTFVPVANRKRPNDAQFGHSGEDFRGAGRWTKPLLRAGVERRGVTRRPVYPGAQAIPAATGLGAMAVHPKAAASNQRPRGQPCGSDPPRIAATSQRGAVVASSRASGVCRTPLTDRVSDIRAEYR